MSVDNSIRVLKLKESINRDSELGEQLAELVLAHVRYSAVSYGLHVPDKDELILVSVDGDEVYVDFSEYVSQEVFTQRGYDDEAIDNHLGYIMNHLPECIHNGSRHRTDGSQLIEGSPSIAELIIGVEESLSPRVEDSVLDSFKLESPSSFGSMEKMHAEFLRILEEVREEERAHAERMLETERAHSEKQLENVTLRFRGMIDILTKELDSAHETNKNLRKLAAIPAYRAPAGRK